MIDVVLAVFSESRTAECERKSEMRELIIRQLRGLH